VKGDSVSFAATSVRLLGACVAVGGKDVVVVVVVGSMVGKEVAVSFVVVVGMMLGACEGESVKDEEEDDDDVVGAMLAEAAGGVSFCSLLLLVVSTRAILFLAVPVVESSVRFPLSCNVGRIPCSSTGRL
jgi:hypothetical protein